MYYQTERMSQNLASLLRQILQFFLNDAIKRHEFFKDKTYTYTYLNETFTIFNKALNGTTNEYGFNEHFLLQQQT